VGPPYALALVIAFLGAWLASGAGPEELLPHLAAGLGYVHAPLVGGVNPINGPLWSLEVEIQFYVLLPVLAAVFAVRSRLVRRSVIVGGALAITWAQASGISNAGWLSVSVGNYLQFFLMGFLLADVYLVEWRGNPRGRLGWDIVSLVGWPALVAVSVLGSPTIEHLVLPWLGAMVVAAALRGPVAGRFLSNRWLVAAGAISYSIYLLHYPLLLLLARVAAPVATGNHVLNLLMVVAVATPAIILAGGTFFRFVERPFMDPEWPRRLTERIRELTRPAPRTTEAAELFDQTAA
jgi:peptidoglycan/LPS O-acetylase OafA/YrhL